jgi:urea transport system permease protein
MANHRKKGGMMQTAIPFVLNALTLISILLIVSMGLAIIFGLMNVINLAHGEFITIGAFTLVAVQAAGGSFWLALVLGPAVGYCVGLALEKVLIARVYKNPLHAILVTWGLSLIIQQVLVLTFGAAPQRAVGPFAGAIDIAGANYPAYRLFLIGFALATFVVTILLFKRTRFGLDLRASIQSAEMAAVMGVNADKINARAFASGAALAALAGVLLAPLTSVTAYMGINYLARSFFVVLVGGAGSVAGVAAGSSIIGGLETALSYQIPTTVAQALVLVLAIVILRFRPNGILSS